MHGDLFHENLTLARPDPDEDYTGPTNLLFFSSRRRHTMSKRDWSSDVCYSDLVAWVAERKDVLSTFFALLTLLSYTRFAQQPEVGRASRRERVEISAVAVSL